MKITLIALFLTAFSIQSNAQTFDQIVDAELKIASGYPAGINNNMVSKNFKDACKMAFVLRITSEALLATGTQMQKAAIAKDRWTVRNLSLMQENLRVVNDFCTNGTTTAIQATKAAANMAGMLGME